MVETEGSKNTYLDEEQPVLMIDETEEQQYVETQYLDQYHLDNGQADNQMNSRGKESRPPISLKLLNAQANDLVCTQAAITIVIPKSMFTFDTEGALVGVKPTDGTSQR